jgi:hypothetical protein
MNCLIAKASVISTAWGLADCLVEVLPKFTETKLIKLSRCLTLIDFQLGA